MAIHSLERVYEEQRLYSVVVPCRGVGLLADIERSLNLGGHVVKSRLTLDEAKNFLTIAKRIKGQDRAMIRNIFD